MAAKKTAKPSTTRPAAAKPRTASAASALLAVGDQAPALSASDQHGNTVTLASLRGRNTLLFFYPKADTPG